MRSLSDEEQRALRSYTVRCAVSLSPSHELRLPSNFHLFRPVADLTPQYLGSDNSALYRLLLGPIADSLAHRLPRSLAPNAITLFGLLLITLSSAATVASSPSLSGHFSPHSTTFIPHFSTAAPHHHAPVSLPSPAGEVSRSNCALYGICLLVYQTLDNLDGRQARRTGSSSPLGLLFDHCADALCTAVGSISTCATFGLANEHPLAPLALVSAVCVPLALSTWEQLCTGVFRLPTVNAPSDGLLAQALLMLFTAVLGPGLWQQRSRRLYLGFVVACSLASSISSALEVHKCSHRGVARSLKPLVHVVLPPATALIWYAAAGPATLGIITLPLAVGLLIAAQVQEILLAHMVGRSDARENFLRPPGVAAPMLIALGASFIAGISQYQGEPIASGPAKTLAVTYATLSAATYAFNALSILRACSRALNVPILRLQSEPVKRDKAS